MNEFVVEADVDLDELARKIREQKSACESFFANRQTRISDVENRLISEIETIRTQLDRWVDFHLQLESIQEAIKKQQQELDRVSVELQSRSCELDEQRMEIDSTRVKMCEELEAERAKLQEVPNEEHADVLASVEALKSEMDTQTTLRAQIESDRDALNEQLAEQHARFARLEDDAREAKEELLSARHEEHELRSQLAESRKLLDQRAKQLKTLRENVEHERKHGKVAAANEAELDQLRQERDQLQRKSQKLEQQLTEHLANQNSENELSDLRRRFEMAVEDVRKLRKANEQLERKVQRTSKSAKDEPISWDDRKQQLQSQAAGNDNPSLAKDMATLNDAVRMTDEIVAQKDQQIVELMSKLQRLQDAVEQAAQEKIDQADADKAVAQSAEQERLRKLQEEWREKLRGAEVEIAVQRAENARRRARS